MLPDLLLATFQLWHSVLLVYGHFGETGSGGKQIIFVLPPLYGDSNMDKPQSYQW